MELKRNLNSTNVCCIKTQVSQINSLCLTSSLIMICIIKNGVYENFCDHIIRMSCIWKFLSIFYFCLVKFLHILQAETEQGVAQAIIRSVIDFKRDPWPIVSDNAKDLVRKMLDPDPKKRLTAQEVLGTSFIPLLMIMLGFSILCFTTKWFSLLFICRTSVVTKCQKGTKCFIGWDCESKA